MRIFPILGDRETMHVKVMFKRGTKRLQYIRTGTADYCMEFENILEDVLYNSLS